jgi:hypothetical protein
MASWLKDALPEQTDFRSVRRKFPGLNFRELRVTKQVFLAISLSRETLKSERAVSEVFSTPSLPPRSPSQEKNQFILS